MPNIKSAIKRVSVIETKTLKNNMIKSEYKTAVKKFETAVADGNKEKLDDLVLLQLVQDWTADNCKQVEKADK